jgi:hypothetical protein
MRKNIVLAVLSVLTLFSFSACDEDSLYEHPENLQGDFEVLYFVERAGDSIVVRQDPDPEAPIMIHFGLSGLVADTLMVRYESQARPNEMWGDVKVFGRNSFRINNSQSTEALPTQWEKLFADALSRSETYRLKDDRLLILYGNPENMVVLSPVKK